MRFKKHDAMRHIAAIFQRLASTSIDVEAFSAATTDAFLKHHSLERSEVDLGIHLCAEKLFHHTVRLPREAARQLDSALARDLAAKAPFRTQDIHVDWTRSDAENTRTVLVLQWTVRRQIVIDAAASLKLDSADIAFVEGAGTDGAVPTIRLRENLENGETWFSKVTCSLTVSAVLLALLATGADYYRLRANPPRLRWRTRGWPRRGRCGLERFERVQIPFLPIAPRPSAVSVKKAISECDAPSKAATPASRRVHGTVLSAQPGGAARARAPRA